MTPRRHRTEGSREWEEMTGQRHRANIREPASWSSAPCRCPSPRSGGEHDAAGPGRHDALGQDIGQSLQRPALERGFPQPAASVRLAVLITDDRLSASRATRVMCAPRTRHGARYANSIRTGHGTMTAPVVVVVSIDMLPVALTSRIAMNLANDPGL